MERWMARINRTTATSNNSNRREKYARRRGNDSAHESTQYTERRTNVATILISIVKFGLGYIHYILSVMLLGRAISTAKTRVLLSIRTLRVNRRPVDSLASDTTRHDKQQTQLRLV